VQRRLKELRAKLPTAAAVSTAFQEVAAGGRGLSAFGLRLFCQSAGVPLQSRWEQVALLTLLDLDRDGVVTEKELLYWMGTPSQADGARSGAPLAVPPARAAAAPTASEPDPGMPPAEEC